MTKDKTVTVTLPVAQWQALLEARSGTTHPALDKAYQVISAKVYGKPKSE